MEISETTDVLIESIELTSSSPAIDSRMDSVSLSADITPETATNRTIFWQLISGTEIATLSQDGSLVALGDGDGIVKVRATAIDGSEVFSELEFTISNQVLVESINLTASAGKINTPGGTIQFTGTALPEEAFNKELFWELMNSEDIASLSQSGLLAALGTGDGEVVIRVSTTDGSMIFKELTISLTNQKTGLESWSTEEISSWVLSNTIYYRIPTTISECRVSLYSLNGKIVYTEILPPNSSSGSINLWKENIGLYILEFADLQNRYTVFVPIK
jgi:hypothetical protein